MTTLPEFSIEKALEFVGDNSTYQKRRLLILAIPILTFAILTCRLPLMNPNLNIAFLFASGIGQIICPVYMSLKVIAMGSIAFCGLATVSYPISSFFWDFSLLGMGFFGRGYFIASLVYLTQIGGDKFRSWSMIVVFGIWGFSSFILSLQRILHIGQIYWVYFLILLPFYVGNYFTLQFVKQSPLKLYGKRNFQQAKIVLNDMAKQNKRSYLPYGLQGETQADSLSSSLIGKRQGYFNLLTNPTLKRITIPLLILWIYRQYIYYGSYIIVPQLGNEVSKNLILMSVSEIVAVLMSYPIKLRVKRVNAFFGFTSVIGICCLISSFTTVDEQCMQSGFACATKYIYRFSIMLIRFSISLIANILINYTLEIYPVNVRNLGFTFCLNASSLGSTVLPWLIQSFIYIDLSGFIGFVLASIVTLYFIMNLQQTNGKMKTQSLQQLQKNQPMISLQNWAALSFN